MLTRCSILGNSGLLTSLKNWRHIRTTNKKKIDRVNCWERGGAV